MNKKRTRDGLSANPTTKRRFRVSPFRKIEQLADALGDCFQSLCTQSGFARDRLIALSDAVCRLNRQYPDACLASVHFLGSRPHNTLHPIFSVFLTELIADALKFNAERHKLLCRAALTANLGMFENHEQWACQEGPLTGQQRRLRDRHPAASVDRLSAAGVDDRDWLETVLQHHELIDGSGYPNRLAGKAVRCEASILSVVDRYLAFVMPRLPRYRVHPTIALQHIYQHSGIYDESVIAAFVKQLGIYPPGTAVRLSNGDIAVVTHRRIGDSVHPRVVSVGGAGDKPYAQPVPRDTTVSEFEIKELYTGGRQSALSPSRLSKYWSDDEGS